jgi:sterol desaturase/sphingolipid hydroxylase (fatty acid hydroxylase superfamily)
MNTGSEAVIPAVRQAPLLFQCLVFPVVMVSAVTGTWWLLNQGVDPALSFLGPQLTAFLAVAFAERVFPYHQSWLHSHHDIRVDSIHTVNIGVATVLVASLVVAAGITVGGWVSQFVEIRLWPTQWPLVAQIALALLIGELPGYWVHRWQHAWDGMWRFHSVHHSAPRLYWLNAGRFHPIDFLSTYVPTYMLLVALGAGVDILAFFGLISAIHGIFQHANLQMKLGPLNWIFSMAELHRWHHSRTLEESNTNFGQTISVWDWVFGTRFLPKDREPPRDIGIPSLPAFPMTWWGQILAPFRWRKVKEESAAVASHTEHQGSVLNETS